MNDDGGEIDLNFVVEGDFFDGEEFVPVIETDPVDQVNLPEEVYEPEEVDNDFDDDM